jgi:dihydrofolate synthase / folylpolyglutamate synthase
MVDDKLDDEYQATLRFLYEQLPMFQRVGPVAFKKDLTNTIRVLEGMGNPHHNIRSIHIAGTNGKGSVAHMLAALSMENNLKTGIYTSPHYKDFRERIKIGPEYIHKDKVVKFYNQYRPLIEEIKPSFFEMTVAMAFWYFNLEKVDIAVIETGLGGRLDSTNVISPEISVVTNIGWDHMAMLGDTLPQIAYEKAGIIKRNIPVVIGESGSETDLVFEEKAKSMEAPIIFADQKYQFTNLEQGLGYTRGTLIDDHGGHIDFNTDLSGPFQKFNIRTFYAAAKVLEAKGVLKANPSIIQSALTDLRTRTGFLGRWVLLSDKPLVLCDSAHNYDGLSMLFNSLDTIDFQRLHVVFGTVDDKDLNKLNTLFPKEAHYYLAKANVPRGMDVDRLLDHFKSIGLQGTKYQSVKDAFESAKKNAEIEDLIVVCGSIFVVAEVI